MPVDCLPIVINTGKNTQPEGPMHYSCPFSRVSNYGNGSLKAMKRFHLSCEVLGTLFFVTAMKYLL